MKKSVCFGLLLIVCAFLLTDLVTGTGAPKSRMAPLEFLAVRVASSDYDIEQKATIEIYNEAIRELEARLIAYGAGTETEASLLDAMDRAMSGGVDLNHGSRCGRSFSPIELEKRIGIWKGFSKQTEEIRKLMARRTEDRKLDKARTGADLHRARSLCMRANLELWRLDSSVNSVVTIKKEPVVTIKESVEVKVPSLIPVP